MAGEVKAEVKSGKKQIAVREFKTANELYGKQVSPGEDTFARLGTPKLVTKDAAGKSTQIEMSPENVGSFFNLLALTVGASIVTFNSKHRGYLRTLVLNADDNMLSDNRQLIIPVTDSKRFPLGGIVVSMKDALALASLHEKIMQDSAKMFPPSETTVANKKTEKNKTEEVAYSVY